MWIGIGAACAAAVVLLVVVVVVSTILMKRYVKIHKGTAAVNSL